MGTMNQTVDSSLGKSRPKPHHHYAHRDQIINIP